MSNGGIEGIEAAKRAAGGFRELARRLGIRDTSVGKWRRVPEARLYQVETVTGVAAEILRPDLVSSIRITKQQQLLARARERHVFSGAIARVSGPGVPGRKTVDLFELGLIVAAQQFAADNRDLCPADVLHGEGWEEKSARAYGMALAVVVGRVSSTTIAEALGGSRQNVENAAARYLRARDGDDEDDLEEGFVMERGRRRRAKDGDADLWAAEQRFLEWLEGRSD